MGCDFYCRRLVLLGQLIKNLIDHFFGALLLFIVAAIVKFRVIQVELFG